jgi:hypothetical protein
MIAKTEFADVRFKVSEYEDGTPYIDTQENVTKNLSFNLQLKNGTSFEEAQTIVSYLNQWIARVVVSNL